MPKVDQGLVSYAGVEPVIYSTSCIGSEGSLKECKTQQVGECRNGDLAGVKCQGICFHPQDGVVYLLS